MSKIDQLNIIREVLIHQIFAAKTDSLPLGIIGDPAKQAKVAYEIDRPFRSRVESAAAQLMTALNQPV